MNDYDRAAERVDKKLKFYNELKAYVVVNAVLAIINFFVSPFFWWVLFPVFFWGIGILVDFFIAFIFVDNYSEEYRKRKIAEEMEKMKL